MLSIWPSQKYHELLLTNAFIGTCFTNFLEKCNSPSCLAIPPFRYCCLLSSHSEYDYIKPAFCYLTLLEDFPARFQARNWRSTGSYWCSTAESHIFCGINPDHSVTFKTEMPLVNLKSWMQTLLIILWPCSEESGLLAVLKPWNRGEHLVQLSQLCQLLQNIYIWKRGGWPHLIEGKLLLTIIQKRSKTQHCTLHQEHLFLRVQYTVSRIKNCLDSYVFASGHWVQTRPLSAPPR